MVIRINQQISKAIILITILSHNLFGSFRSSNITPEENHLSSLATTIPIGITFTSKSVYFRDSGVDAAETRGSEAAASAASAAAGLETFRSVLNHTQQALGTAEHQYARLRGLPAKSAADYKISNSAGAAMRDVLGCLSF